MNGRATRLMAVLVAVLSAASCTSGQHSSQLDALGAGTEAALKELVQELQPDNIPHFVNCILEDPAEKNCDNRAVPLRVLMQTFDIAGFQCSTCSPEIMEQVCLIRNSVAAHPDQCTKLQTGLKFVTEVCANSLGCDGVPTAQERADLLQL
nr:uncharacterized protein LOC128703799 isoform X1 [Cherax quadricarinatus]